MGGDLRRQHETVKLLRSLVQPAQRRSHGQASMSSSAWLLNRLYAAAGEPPVRMALRCLGLIAAEMVTAHAKALAAQRTEDLVLLAQSIAATGADGNRWALAAHYPLGYQASGNHLLAPAFRFDEGSHDVLLSL
jgi:hypothetical protein